MKPQTVFKIFGALIFALTFTMTSSTALAHCDSLDGPVVQSAQEALKTNNVNLALIWVKKNDEAEIRKTFTEAMAVRRLSDEARDLADRSFFEALVRVHRAGEGAPFTGLKPAGRDLGPAIPAADRALREGNVSGLKQLLLEAVSRGLSEHFAKALSRKDFDKNNVEAGREFVEAYVEYIHCVEAIYERAKGPVHGHYLEERASPGHEH